MKNVLVVAVDGNAGCGKSSICATTCQKNGWVYINTGALYRGLGYLAHKEQTKTENTDELSKLLENFSQNYSWDESSNSLNYKGVDISEFLIAEEVGFKASQIASKKLVREKLLPLQRNLIESYKNQIVLVDGRDIGTVVYPDAPLKLFMSASLEARAIRRLKQLEDSEQKHKMSLEELKKEMLKRDVNDSSREIAPLAKAEDAVLFDTSNLTFEECVIKLTQLVRETKTKQKNKENL